MSHLPLIVGYGGINSAGRSIFDFSHQRMLFDSIDLKNQKCQACSGDTPVFNENQISDHLAKLDNWTVNDEQKMIYKKFTLKFSFTNFTNFSLRLIFINS